MQTTVNRRFTAFRQIFLAVLAQSPPRPYIEKVRIAFTGICIAAIDGKHKLTDVYSARRLTQFGVFCQISYECNFIHLFRSPYSPNASKKSA